MVFQSTHPHRVRLADIQQYISRLRVSIHAPTQGATSVNCRNSGPFKFQSTHPHRVRPHYLSWVHMIGIVSIHAPTQGATFITSKDYITYDVSIHAPTQGATAAPLAPRAFCSVSIHAPTQGATSVNQFAKSLTSVSIHAPTQGATFCRYVVATWYTCFNPRTHTGCDGSSPAYQEQERQFQSTHPHRVRPK